MAVVPPDDGLSRISDAKWLPTALFLKRCRGEITSLWASSMNDGSGGQMCTIRRIAGTVSSAPGPTSPEPPELEQRCWGPRRGVQQRRTAERSGTKNNNIGNNEYPSPRPKTGAGPARQHPDRLAHQRRPRGRGTRASARPGRKHRLRRFAFESNAAVATSTNWQPPTNASLASTAG